MPTFCIALLKIHDLPNSFRLIAKDRLELGNLVTIHVQQTGGVAHGRIVFASYKESPHYGVELDKPANIWGLTDADGNELAPETARGV